MPKTNHPRISQLEWEMHKETIRKIYLSEDKSLIGEGGVIDLMKRKGFSASKPQYESQFMRWGFKKKLTRETWHIIGHIIKDQGEAGPFSRVYVHGTRLTAEKVKKETARYRCEANEESCLKKELPTGIEVLLDQESDQDEAEETTPSLETQNTHFNNLQMTRPLNNLHVPEEPCNSTWDYNWNQMNNPDNLYDIYNRVVTDHPTPNFCMDTSPYFLHSDTLSLVASIQQSPPFFSPGIQEFQDILNIPRNTISLFTDLNKPLFRGFRALFRNNQSTILASIDKTKYLLPRESGRELQKDSVDVVILKQILYLLMNNFAGSDYAVFDSIFEQVRQFSAAHMRDMLNALPRPYAAALEQNILTIAIKSNIPALVNLLLQRGLDVNRVTCRFGGCQYTPLGLACKFRHLEVVNILLHKGADSNAMIAQDITTSPIFLLIGLKFNRSVGELLIADKESPPPIVGDIFRCLLDASTRTHCKVLETSMFWENEALIDAFIKHNKLPIDTSHGSILPPYSMPPQGMELCKAEKIAAVIQSAFQGITLQDDSYFKKSLEWALQIASCQGSISVIDYCLGLGLSPNVECLCQAIYGNNLALVKRYMELGVDINKASPFLFPGRDPTRIFPSKVDSCLLEGYSLTGSPTTAFAEAIRHGRHDVVSLFKNCGLLPVNMNSHDGGRAMLAAAEVGDGHMAQELLAADKKNTKIVEYSTIMSVAAATLSGNDDIVELLMTAGVRPDYISISTAILTRNARLVELFLNSAIVNRGGTGLAFLAVRWGDCDILRLLIDAGVNLSGSRTSLYPLHVPSLEKSETLLSPIEEAIRQGNHEVVQLLLEIGVDVNVYPDMNFDPDMNFYPGMNYTSPLAQAVEYGDEQLIQTLLDHGVDPNDRFALKSAAEKSYKLTGAILASFCQRYPNGDKNFAVPALRQAIVREDETMVSMLARHADINAVTFSQNPDRQCLPSPLGNGIVTGSIKIVQTLLNSGGNPDSTVELSDKGRLNAVLKAISTGNLGMVKLLHNAGANLNFSATLGITRTALQLAVELGHFEIVEYLLSQGVDVNAPPCIWEGGTALQLAAKTGSIRIAQLLLDRDAYIDAPRSKYLGRTAFEFAAEHGRMDMLLLLFDRRVDIASDHGEQIRRAQELAEENGQIAAKNLVQQLGAEAQRRAPSTFVDDFSWEPMTDTSADVRLLDIR